MLKWFMLTVYITLCCYVMWSFCRWTKKIYLPKRRAFNIIVCGLILIFAASIFLGKFLPENDYQLLILRFSNYWIGFLIYLIFFILTADLFLLLLKLASRYIKSSKHLLSSVFLRTILGFLVILLSISFTVYGCFHAKMLTTAHYKATIQKSAGNLTDLRMILLGDFHLGYSVGCSQIEDMVAAINSENADIVVIAGDIFDNNFDALDNPERLEMLLKKSNISVLEDETAIIDNSFYLTGRLDEKRTGNGKKKRASLDELTKNLDPSMPLFVISHEPDHLSDYNAHGVDIVLSGHTHAGQFFPLTIVQPFVWENYWGMKMIDSMYSFVTSGIGVYGPDMRVGTNSEVMVIDVHFE